MTLVKQPWVPVFKEFIKYIRINSKEVASIDEKGAPLNLWESQKIVLDRIEHGMERGKHSFCVLKSRQLGLSTFTVALDTFWLAFFSRITGALVTENDKNSEIFREMVKSYIRSLPKGFFGSKFDIVNDNDKFMSFTNGSRLDFLVAGKNKENWGEGSGYVLAHLTEVAAYGKPAGLASFREALSETHPQRLVIYESTAKGMNLYKALWEEHKRDEFSKEAIFVGWYHKPMNKILRNDPRFKVYGVADYDPVEEELLEDVKTKYGYSISREQMAWYRWRQSDTSVTQQDMNQNQPFTEEMAFVATGYSFFQMGVLEKELERCTKLIFTGYKYLIGNDFWTVECEQITDPNRLPEVTLRIWEEPDENGFYAIGVDPAHGRDEDNDRHAISVWRCFGDKLVQVAEYADNEIGTKQAAWVLAHLAGAYRNCVINVESAPGPGGVIMNEVENLRDKMRIDPRFDNNTDKNPNWDDFLANARWYLYRKYDHYGPGTVKGWESNYKTKIQLMNQIHDNFLGDKVLVRSVPLIKEMMSVIRRGDQIGAPESEYDDRVFGMALANRGWIDSWMMNLLAQGVVYDDYLKEISGEPVDKSTKMINNIVRDFMKNAAERAETPQIDPHKQWLYDKGFM
jgi:hypothetical protein